MNESRAAVEPKQFFVHKPPGVCGVDLAEGVKVLFKQLDTRCLAERRSLWLFLLRHPQALLGRAPRLPSRRSDKQPMLNPPDPVLHRCCAVFDDSMRMALRPRSAATSPVVPLPANGSSTVSPSVVVGRIICRTSSRGQIAT